MEDIPSKGLNSFLSHFLYKVTKINGEAFDPGTSFQRRFDRHLRQIGKMLKYPARQNISAGKVLEEKNNLGDIPLVHLSMQYG